eukprot:2327573-Pleurochrysis_carterae.AAC.1
MDGITTRLTKFLNKRIWFECNYVTDSTHSIRGCRLGALPRSLDASHLCYEVDTWVCSTPSTDFSASGIAPHQPQSSRSTMAGADPAQLEIDKVVDAAASASASVSANADDDDDDHDANDDSQLLLCI